MYAVSVRVPVTRTYPSEVAIPGKLYLNVSVASLLAVCPKARVVCRGSAGEEFNAEVMQCNITSRPETDFKYSLVVTH